MSETRRYIVNVQYQGWEDVEVEATSIKEFSIRFAKQLSN